MDKKRVIKLNENDEYLSLGNIFRLIKEMAIDSSSFLQTDLFSIIFNCDIVANSTVNNYCTGQRAINAKYKNYMLEKRKAYLNDNNSFTSEVGTILNLINTGKFETINMKIEQINNDTKFKYICSKLYTISKNDIDVNSALSNKLFKYLNSNNLYNFFVEALFFAVLERVQPIYKENAISDLIEKNLVNTNISVANIEKYMKLQLKEGIWSIRGISELAKENNPFACFEMASLEFYGVVSGKPRYQKAYDYYKIASKNNHPVANWAIGFLYYSGYIGKKSDEDLELAYKYFEKAIEQKCPSAFNSMGLVHLRGDVPNIKKNTKKAIEYFEKGAEYGNVYAYNNLGKIEENKKNYKKAFQYYVLASNLGDSWALNKVGECYRLGIGTEKNLSEAFKNYELSSECFKYSLCPWSKYNLAKYFYQYGVPELDIHASVEKAIELLKDISDELIEAVELLIYIYYDLYLKSKKENEEYYYNIKFYISKIEKNIHYTEIIKNRIEENIEKCYTENINIEKFLK